MVVAISTICSQMSKDVLNFNPVMLLSKPKKHKNKIMRKYIRVLAKHTKPVHWSQPPKHLCILEAT